MPLARALSAKSGLDLGSVMQLLPLLAPILMGFLGKKSGSSDDGFGLDDLGNILGRETNDAKSKNPDIGDILDSLGGGGGSSGGGGGILDSLKDMLGGRSG